MAVRAPTGFRIRSTRKALGLTQAELAKRAGISPSYLNLIEANKREIGGALLNKIAGLIGVETDSLTGRTEQRLTNELCEIVTEPLVQRLKLTPESAAELIGRHPDWARALLTIYRAWQDQSAASRALADRLSQDPVLSDTLYQMLSQVTAIRSSSEILDDMPDIDAESRKRFQEIISVESRRLSETSQSLARLFDTAGKPGMAFSPADEVDDFFYENNAWFPALEDLGSEVRQRLLEAGGMDGVSLSTYLASVHHLRVAQVPGATRNGETMNGGDAPVSANGAAGGHLTIGENLPSASRRFQLVRHIALQESTAAIDKIMEGGDFSSDAARERCRSALASYVAGAIVFPYDSFLASAEDCRYDIELLQQRFDASFEQVCHRLVTLKNPRHPGVPFAFIRSDPAGHVGKRFPLPGLPLLRYGHSCSLWAVFNAFQAPGRILRRLTEFPDGERFLMVAQAVTKQRAAFHEAPVMQSVMLICDELNAGRTIYADGLDLNSSRAAVPVGPSCRMCPRPHCRFRGEAQIVRT